MKSKTVVFIEDRDGSREVDLGPVEGLVEAVEKNWREGKFSYPEDWFVVLRESNPDQLRHLAAHLLSLANENARLYHSAFTKKHVELVQDLHKLRDLAKVQGLELWPEMDDE